MFLVSIIKDNRNIFIWYCNTSGSRYLLSVIRYYLLSVMTNRGKKIQNIFSDLLSLGGGDNVGDQEEEKTLIDVVDLAYQQPVMPSSISGKNMGWICDEISVALECYLVGNGGFEIDTELMQQQLEGYHVVKKIEDVVIGRYIRWLMIGKDGMMKLSNGGFVVGIKENVNGEMNILCRNGVRNFIQCRFELDKIFQQLSKEELMILMLS